jgi:hypothetical protein
MGKRIALFTSLCVCSLGFLCSEIDIGTDVDKIGDIVSSGKVQRNL